VLAAAACAPAPPPATTPRPAAPTSGPRLIEYPFVTLAEREGKILGLVEDLVIEERDDDWNFNFNDARDMDVDDAGRIYVHDSERRRIQVYAPDGSFANSFGTAAGVSPFHFGWLVVAGGRLAFSTGTAIAVWSLDGEYLYDRSLTRSAFNPPVYGTDDGALIGSFILVVDEGGSSLRVERIALDEDESLSYADIPRARRSRLRPTARAAFAAVASGAVYLTAGDEYRVRAFDAQGAESWILQVDAPRPTPDGEPLPALAGAQGRGLAAIGRGYPIRADGRGNVYVFPLPPEGWDRPVVPVDVYSPDGERLFAGMMPSRSWLRARQEFVYGIELDDASGRQRIVRYRLITPF